eukprot:m.132984 g.132984  ORF g.132984 m.132984 type:complete len:281 (+) comp17517_c0_seq2:134-976(+)
MSAKSKLAQYTNITSLKGQTAFVTGATAGIGEAIAWRLAAEGMRLIVSGRREERLSSLKKELEEAFPEIQVLTMKLDMRDVPAVTAIQETLPADWKDVDILVNNAGLALGVNAVDATETDDIRGMVETNVIGLMLMTTAITKRMRTRGCGHVISIGSISGHFTYPGGSVYCATKFAVDGYMRAVQSDLCSTPIRVSTISPGFCESEFSLVRFKGDADKAKSVYNDIVALTPADCADAVIYAATRPAHVQIGEIVVWPTNQAVGGVNLSRVGESLGAPAAK